MHKHVRRTVHRHVTGTQVSKVVHTNVALECILSNKCMLDDGHILYEVVLGKPSNIICEYQ